MNLHVERYGAGEPAVFVHGAGGSSSAWYFQKEYLKRFMEVILVDLPGHGEASGILPQTIEEKRDIIRQALEELAIPKCYLVGHSMGGAISMSFALQYPELLKGLILVATGARLRVHPEILGAIMRDKAKAARQIMELAFGEKTAPMMVEAAIDELMKANAQVIYNDFMSCERFDLMGALGGIQNPTLIIGGEEDRLAPVHYSEYLHREIRGSKLVLIPGAGHMAPLEKPAEVNKAIKNFILSA
jgi:pimeloyl-ACP methyl ester carboxylesterase